MTILVGQAGGIKLAPDSGMLSRNSSASSQNYSEVVTMVAGVENDILPLTGKHAISLLSIVGLSNESMTLRLICDGVEISSATRIISGGVWYIYGVSSTLGATDIPFVVDASFSLMLTTTTDTSITIQSIFRKIL